MANTLSFIDQLQGASYDSLLATSFQIGIVDPDSSALTTSQISTLESSGKSLIAYLSIGEAENFRSYWNASWNTSPPSFVMGADPNWTGDYYVKYWDPQWQQLMINQVTAMAKEGYNGVMLDVVDAYTVPAVAAADGGITQARTDMMNFVEALSEAAKAVNPNFKIIQNNALDLLTTNPDDPTSATNTAYLSHIDGVVAESTFYNSNNTPTSWEAWNVQYLEHAVAAGKTVLSIDYPTSAAAQAAYIKDAIADGFVPYAADQNLDATVPSIDYTVPGQLASNALSSVLSDTGTSSSSTSSSSSSSSGSTTSGSSTGATSSGTSTSIGAPSTGSESSGSSSSSSASGTTSTITPISGDDVVTVANGTSTVKVTAMNTELVFGSNYEGNTTVKWFATASHDVIDVAPSIFSSTAQALENVTYSGSKAIINLNGHGTVTITGAGHDSLTAADFHIG